MFKNKHLTMKNFKIVSLILSLIALTLSLKGQSLETSFKGNNFSTGNHTVILVCDGVIKDVKQFIKL